MKSVSIRSYWQATVEVEVPDDTDTDDWGRLDAIPESVLDQIDTSGAELVDWDWTDL